MLGEKKKTNVIVCWLLFLLELFCLNDAYRIYDLQTQLPNGSYPQPFQAGFVGYYGDPSNFVRERINEGAFYTADQELLYGGVSARQSCPGMVGPFSDGNYYCSAREFGYCDRRSGTCFCNMGYQGIDCTDCTITHFKIGPHCYPKKLCTDDCSGAGTCNYNNGTCSCLPHRTGEYCQTLLCTTHDPLCITCTAAECLQCQGGYYLTGNSSRVCSSCYDFDPRCAGCILEQGCTTCADSVLTSVRRSGYRSSDPQLPPEEVSREFSITLPFGTKSAESFAEAENYVVVTTPSNSLKSKSTTCSQGLHNDSSWDCSDYAVSHIVCGHYGVFSFLYPNFAISEDAKFIRMYVQRTGGGYGNVSVSYYIQHYTTNDSDVVATAKYTTNQTLQFSDGIVQLSFLITIVDDNIPEDNEVFQVVLETPNGGGSVGAQFRANVTIIDDDVNKIAAKLTNPNVTALTTTAMEPFAVSIQATLATGQRMTVGGEKFLAIVENDLNAWTGLDPIFGYQRNADRFICNNTDLGNGTYILNCPGILQQGSYQLRIWNAFPQSLKGQYYYDAFFERLALTRLDVNVNFTWGTGRLMPRGSDYISIRWSGAVLTQSTGYYYFKVNADDHARLWVNGKLLLDHFHERDVYLEPSFPIFLSERTLYEIILEYREINGNAYAVLLWKPPNQQMEVIPYDNLYSLFEINLSPVIIHVNSSETSANTTECTGNGLYSAVARHPSTFSICPRDSYGNLRDDGDEFYLQTQIFSSKLVLTEDDGYHGIGAEIITPRLTYNDATHCFDAIYTPQRAGTYNLHVEYQPTPDIPPSDVVGSPFIVTVTPDQSSGPISEVFGLPNPLNLDAGSCSNFTIVMRDNSFNLRLQGGDNIEVYAYRVSYFRQKDGTEPSPTASPTFVPTAAPTSSVSHEIASDAGYEIVRYGIVSDLGNGNYSVQICPIIAGVYEIQILLKGKGLSNQPFRILDKSLSLTEPSGYGSFYGQYIAQSPYTLNVRHTIASVITSTVEGDGLTNATVGIISSFMLTVRDPFDNVLRDNYLSPTVSLRLDKSPNASVSVWNYMNGSYLLHYTPLLEGTNIISVFVNQKQILGSPFYVTTTAGATNASFSYALGNGLVTGVTGEPSYFTLYSFDLHGNRKADYDDNYYFVVSGANSITGEMMPCPFPRDPNNPVCDPNDSLGGYYYGEFTPLYTGSMEIQVYLSPSGAAPPSSGSGRRFLSQQPELYQISNSPFHAIVYPSSPNASLTNVWGTLYDNTAGVPAYIYLQTRDNYDNKLITGGANIECAILGVGVQWGTVQPFNDTQGLPNQYNYKGFFYGYPDFYSNNILDYQNGSYQIEYNVNITGEYVLRLALAETGLNATYFNDTFFGILYNDNTYSQQYVNSLLGQPINDGTTISWTGDIGGLESTQGDRGLSSYFDRYYSRTESQIAVNATRGIANYFQQTNINDNNNSTIRYHFREHYWSARWTGMITPNYAELYKFTILKDPDSNVNVWIGGIGIATNRSYLGELVINSSSPGNSDQLLVGYYRFTDLLYREFLLEYQHNTGDALLQIYWESISTTKQPIPSSAFSHWRNISHYNLTIHPTTLCPSCSTAWGKALTSAKVHQSQSFLIYGRDIYNNLVQHGGDRPSMVAVGPNGVAFRGKITDYGNSTYLIQYYPTQSGIFRMYVSIGCCAPNPAIGMNNEIQKLQPLLIAGAPFLLQIDPAPLEPSRCVATGNGLIGANAAQLTTFTIYYRDIFNNPTSIFLNKGDNYEYSNNNNNNHTAENTISIPLIQIIFTNALTDTLIQPETFQIQQATEWNITYEYSINHAGSYKIAIGISLTNGSTYSPIISSPYLITINPVVADPKKAVCRGNGIRMAATNQPVSFEIQLYDIYYNKLITGGNRFFIRVYGDSNFTQPPASPAVSSSSLTIVPTYVDTQNGRYIVTYQTHYLQAHQLVIKLLQGYNQSLVLPPTHPGGEGLTAYYYNTLDGATNAWLGQSTQFDGPVYERLDAKISFTWNNGYILPISNVASQDSSAFSPLLTSNLLSLRNLGQSIRWFGYLVCPRSDNHYQIYTQSQNMNVTIFIDQQLVFDSIQKIQKTIILSQFSAYEIVIVGKVRPSITEIDTVMIDLRWSTTSIRDQSISTFYLYPKAQEIQFSPFPIEVNS